MNGCVVVLNHFLKLWHTITKLKYFRDLYSWTKIKSAESEFQKFGLRYFTSDLKIEKLVYIYQVFEKFFQKTSA